MNQIKTIAATALALVLVCGVMGHAGERVEHHWQINKRERQDKVSGVPQKILELQSLEKVVPPPMEEAIDVALKAAEEAAQPLIDKGFHKGRRLVVPDEFKTIQKA